MKKTATHKALQGRKCPTCIQILSEQNQLTKSNGEMIAVSDDEILEAMRTTARLGGVFGEPAGIAGAAGLKKALQQGVIKSHESALTIVTGNGLKDIQSAKQAAGEALSIAPNLDALANALSEHLGV